MGDFLIFDNEHALKEANRIEEQRGSPAKVNSSDVGYLKKVAKPSPAITQPWSNREKKIQHKLQTEECFGHKTLGPEVLAEDIDASIFSMDSPGDKNYLYWPYIPDASFEEMSDEINKKIGRDKKRLLNEHSGEIKTAKRSGFDAWLNKGF